MADETKIAWCDKTWSPWEGCTKVSAECANCYADARDARMLSGARHWGPKHNRKPMSESYWRKPHQWSRAAAKTGERVTVFPSLCDPFDDHPSIRSEWRVRLWETIRATPNLIWILLTKRPENLARLLPDDWGGGYPNVCLGVSAGTQAAADTRIPILLDTPARWRMVSVEPQLELVDTNEIPPRRLHGPLSGYCQRHFPAKDCGCHRQQPKIDWVICGCESGPHRRPFDLDWARSLRDQCQAAGVAFFLKQIPGDTRKGVLETPMLDGRQWTETPWDGE